MSSTFQQWLTLVTESCEHSSNATAAICAVDVSTPKVVNRHLRRIYQREQDLADFADILLESPVFQEDAS